MSENNEILQDDASTATIIDEQPIQTAVMEKDAERHNIISQEIVQGMQSLLQDMQTLKQNFDTKVMYDESKERLIDSLHRELQGYREGLHFRILRPIFTDLITLYDDFDKLIESMSVDIDQNRHHMVQSLKMYHDTIEEILRRNGVEAFVVEEEIFLPSKQRNLRVLPTSDPLQDKHIARRVRKGFLYEEKLLRPEIVETYKYTANVIA